MAWQEVTFERQALYERVWTTAVTRLAKEYGLSDVGLRKICDRLAVPVPPLGHWAKVAHGKPSPQTPLPPFDGEATYVHRKWVDEADAARHAKVDSAIAAAPAPSVTITFRDDPSEWHPPVRRTLRSFRKPTIGSRGLYWTAEPECFRATVGSESRPRAMRFLDALWGALAQLGAKTVPGKEGRRHLLVELDGQAMLLAVTESTRRVERELTVEERRRLKQNEHAYISDRHQYEGWPRSWKFPPKSRSSA